MMMRYLAIMIIVIFMCCISRFFFSNRLPCPKEEQSVLGPPINPYFAFARCYCCFRVAKFSYHILVNTASLVQSQVTTLFCYCDLIDFSTPAMLFPHLIWGNTESDASPRGYACQCQFSRSNPKHHLALLY